MSTHQPTSAQTRGDRLGHAWDALSAARDWNMYASAYEALAREYVAAGIAIWEDSVARFAQGQEELGEALSGACRGCVSAWETPWWSQPAAAAPKDDARPAADAAKPAANGAARAH